MTIKTKPQIIKEIRCRFYQEGDEKAILELTKIAFGFEMNVDYWLWQYKNNPAGKGIINMAFHEDRLVSHYAISPTRCFYQGKPRTAGLSMTTMTHPEYQRMGLFPKLADNVYLKAKEEGMPLIYGFPNTLSVKSFEHKLNWTVQNPLSTWILKSSKQNNDFPRGMQFDEIRSLKDLNLDFFASLKDKFSFSIIRDKTYFKWRYLDSPSTTYRLFQLVKDHELIGIVVLKIHKLSNGGMKGNIIDWLVKAPTDLSLLLKYSIDFFLKHHIEDITLWANKEQNELYRFDSNEFIEEDMTEENWGPIMMSFGYLILDSSCDRTKESELMDQFYFTMGDCNIF